jgi:acyl carrier protein
MSEEEVWTNLTDVMRTVFDDDELEIEAATTAADIEDWTSLTHVQLMVALEERFGVRFNTAEIVALDNVGQLVSLILRRSG